MFTTKCFIRKNTLELQDKLKKLGYHICICCKFKDNIWLHNFISDEHNRYEIHGLGAWDVEDNQEELLNLFLIGNAEHPNPAIDCGENEDLFLALAALRDDKPDYQWFVWDDVEDKGEKFKQYIPSEPWQEWWCPFLNTGLVVVFCLCLGIATLWELFKLNILWEKFRNIRIR